MGQYVGSRHNLILNLDGLAKNLKQHRQRQGLDHGHRPADPDRRRPARCPQLAELYKLKARFPIQIDLESSDIKEICYRRLLGKSPEGEQTLGQLFDTHGQALRHNTKLQDATYYDADFDRKTSPTSTPSCRRISTFCSTCWGRWPSPPAASGCARQSR